MPWGRHRRRTGGFTLVELMVTMVVLAILTMVALPSFYNLLRRHQLRTTLDSLRAAVAYARTEAVLRQYSVSLCASSDGSSCSGNGDYSRGWLIYTSQGAVGTPYAGGGAMKLLRVGQGDPHIALLSSTAKPISFAPQGQLSGGAGLGFAACPRSGTVGNGQSTTALAGGLLNISAQGSVYVQALGPQASCSAPTGS